MQLFSSWTGSDFLLVYIVLLGASGFAAWWVPGRFRPAGSLAPSPDCEDIAMLKGGAAAHTDSLLAELFARGGIASNDQGRLRVTEPGLAASPAGRALLGQHEPFTAEEAGRLLAIHQSRIAARLRRMGLLVSDEQLLRLRWLSTAPLVAVLLVGLFLRARAESAPGAGDGFLELLLVLTAVCAVIRFVWIDPRTKAGIETLRRLQGNSEHLRQASSPADAGMAVALFGTGALIGGPWEALHALRRSACDGASSSSDTGGGDCSGDGGGCGD